MTSFKLKPSYRLLTMTELQMLEKPFVKFLATQGIDTGLWKRIKESNDDRLQALIVSFSDYIFERTLNEKLFLQQIAEKEVHCLHCQKEKIIIVKLTTDNATQDFRKCDLADENFYNSNSDIKISLGEQDYGNTNRSQFLFNLIESGYQISDGTLYKLFCLLYTA